MFGLVDRLPLLSQRAPLLSADVDNGAVEETENRGGDKGQEKRGIELRVCVRLKRDYFTKNKMF